MKTFKDLDFKSYPCANGKQARMDFPNGFGVSIVQFKIGNSWASYTSNEDEWEFAVFHDGHLCYTTPITEDVIGHQSDKQITELMARVQQLPAED